jgi:hypothetical protein
MSILETNKIDLVGTRPESSVVRLVIADHLDWSDFDDHAQLVQAKVNTYLEFVESGQMRRLKDPPIPPDFRVEVLLAAQYPPSDAGREFLEQVRRFLEGAGIAFLVEAKAP